MICIAKKINDTFKVTVMLFYWPYVEYTHPQALARVTACTKIRSSEARMVLIYSSKL